MSVEGESLIKEGEQSAVAGKRGVAGHTGYAFAGEEGHVPQITEGLDAANKHE